MGFAEAKSRCTPTDQEYTGGSLLREGASAFAKATEDETKARQRGLYTFLRNEPTVFYGSL
jgi:hypothetical protein